MKVLVTGGAGFIGSHLTERLLQDNHEVIIVDDFSLGKEENLKTVINNPKLKIYKKSIIDDLNELFETENFDIVFHIGALPRVQYSIKNPQFTHDANVGGTFNLLQLCKRHNVKRFIFSSSSSRYGNQDFLPLVENMRPNPMSPYALHKLTGEYYCRLFYNIYGLKTISLIYFNVYGPRASPEGAYAGVIPGFIKAAQKDQELKINGDGNQTRDYTFVDDVVEANILAATTENENSYGEAFNIGASDNISVNNVAKLIMMYSNSQSKIVHGPAVLEPRHTKADIFKAKELLGWIPKVSFEDGLKKTYEYFVETELVNE